MYLLQEVAKRFSVRYYLNLVLVDEEDRRYFKQQVWLFKYETVLNQKNKEITLWRKAELNESRIPTSQFISNQLPNGNFKTQLQPTPTTTTTDSTARPADPPSATPNGGGGDALAAGAVEEPPEEAF